MVYNTVLSVCILLLLYSYCDDCITSPRFVALHRLVSELNIQPEAFFTRTTLLTIIFTAIIVVCSLKSVCIYCDHI